MDGVLWRGTQALPGLQAFFARLRQTNRQFQLVTNNASLTPQAFCSRLAKFGVDIATSEILTSAQGTAIHLKTLPAPNRRVVMVGGDGLQVELQSAGFELVWDEVPQDVSWVVVGRDAKLSWEKLNRAVRALHNGARLVGTNPDATYPTQQGLEIGNGAIVAALQTASGQTPLFVGKPEQHLYQIAMQRLSATAEQTVALGDRLDTDILGAIRAGIASILILTGITSKNDLAHSTIKPTMVVSDLIELTSLF
jgi:4-nitrophenyl phosphatase